MTWKTTIGAALLCGTMAGIATVAHAAGYDYGKFPGVTVKAKLIGGNQYEKLYTRIPIWEKMTGAKVDIVSSKNYFDLDKEIKQDIATGDITWCVGSDHTSFAPQYGDLYTDLSKYIPKSELDKYIPGTLKSSMVDGKLVQLPRMTDVSNIYYQKKLYADPGNQKRYKAKYGEDLAPPKTFKEFKQQAIFFSDPPRMYGTAFAGKDEGMTGRFMEILRANGGDMFDKNWNPTFNSPQGVAALQWFVDLYKAKAVPAGTVNYTWDDIGNAMAAGQLALDLDWPGYASFFNDPKTSKIAGDVGVAEAPVGTAGKHGAWSGSHSFSVTQACKHKKAAVSLIVFLTNHDSQMLEAKMGELPTRSAVFADAEDWFNKNNKPFMATMFKTFRKSLDYARTPPLVPEYIQVSDALWPQLQAAIVGQKTPKQALDDAAAKARQIMEDAGRLKD